MTRTTDIDVGRAAIGGAFATALVGLYALATAGPVGPVPIVVLAGAGLLGVWRLRTGARSAAVTAGEGGTLATGLVTFIFAAIVVPLHAAQTGSWVLAAVDLVVILQANRLLALARGRAVGQVLLLGLLMLLGAAVLTLNVSFLGAVFAFSMAATWTALFLSLLDPDAKGDDRRVPRSFAWVSIAAGLSVFALTCSFFAVLPRVRFQRLSSGFLRAEAMSGFSEEVTLGSIGAVKLDRTPVMRVQIANGDPAKMYWRGMSLDRYRKGRWSVSRTDETRLNANDVGGRMTFNVGRRRNRPTLVAQDITLEPIDVSVLFGLPHMVQIDGELPLVALNSTDSVVFRASSFGRTHYKVLSDIEDSDAPDLLTRAAVPPDGPDARWLSISDELAAAIRPLAQELAGEGSDFRRARRIEAAMQTWSYSLSAPADTRGDPIESFLLDAKKGYCEQYSSGMIMLLRALGIPARMANGFHGGEPNSFGNYWLVRKSDAHSWVEVPFAGAGWITFDPTPGRGGEDRAAVPGVIGQLWDYARQLWLQRVVTYDIVDQFSLVSAAGDRAQNFSEKLQQRMRALEFGAAGGATRAAKPLLGALAFLLVAAAVGAALVRRARRRTRTPAEEAEAWWRSVESVLSAKGFVRRRGETPRELAERAGHRAWADLYYAVRFSLRPPTPRERDEMQRVLESRYKNFS